MQGNSHKKKKVKLLKSRYYSAYSGRARDRNDSIRLVGWRSNDIDIVNII